MIIVKLMGGLGNQLFQYALGRQLAQDRKVPLKLDTAWFQKQTLRTYQLGRFKIAAEIASAGDMAAVTRSQWAGWRRRVAKMIDGRTPYYRRRVIAENTPGFDPLVLKYAPKQAYLSGYWQCQSYFAGIAADLRREITLKEPLSQEFETWSERIRRADAASLHVRRGDYVSNLQSSAVHGVCSPGYYAAAVRALRQRCPGCVLFVFSDDLPWCRDNLGHLSPLEFVGLEGRLQDQEELILMSQCRHHILANSSFSWWGAWLNPTEEKMVFTPERWGNDPAWTAVDIIPPGWIRIKP